jgi:hypothetical protein
MGLDLARESGVDPVVEEVLALVAQPVGAERRQHRDHGQTDDHLHPSPSS